MPIIPLTANVLAGDRERCLAAGMDHYLPKPIRAEELWQAVEGMPAPVVTPAKTVPLVLGKTLVLNRAEILERLGGDEFLLREIVNLFQKEHPGNLESLRQALGRGEADAVHRLAHSFKGALSYLGAHQAQHTALQLETLGRSGDLKDADQTLTTLEQEVQLLLPALNALATPQENTRMNANQSSKNH